MELCALCEEVSGKHWISSSRAFIGNDQPLLYCTFLYAMKRRLENLRSTEELDRRRKLSVQRRRRDSCEMRGGLVIDGAVKFAQSEIGLSVTGRTASSHSDPSVSYRFAQLLQDSTASVWMRSIGFARVCRMLEMESEENPYLPMWIVLYTRPLCWQQ